MSPGHNLPTNYSALVVAVTRKMTRESNTIDQTLLRQCIGLSSSYLVTDTSMNPECGYDSWYTGFNQLVELVVALHTRDELELETMNIASKACSECWSVSGSWRGMEESRDGVRKMAAKLKKCLDENGRTYKGERVYAP